MIYRQESEKDEEHALIPKCAKQMKHSQESETDEEQTLIYLNTDVSRAWNGWRARKNPFDARPTYFSYVTSGKNYDSIFLV